MTTYPFRDDPASETDTFGTNVPFANTSNRVLDAERFAVLVKGNVIDTPVCVIFATLGIPNWTDADAGAGALTAGAGARTAGAGARTAGAGARTAGAGASVEVVPPI